jgi:hypothetical protein
MANRSDRASNLEPTITRLQLELRSRRRLAEACVNAGYRSAGEVAAADDAEFHGSVRLSAAEREEVLALARTPGSHAPAPGKRPVLVSERRPSGKWRAAAKPVKERLVRMAGTREPTPAPRAAGPKVEPPRSTPEERRRRKQEADALEAELDDRLADTR